MNRADLTGRTTKDPEIRYAQGTNPMCIAKFSLAVDRRFKKDGEPTADFINCVAFGKTAEFIEKYVAKGIKIGVCGHIQTGSYKDKDGKTVYTTEVVADEVEFEEKKEQAPKQDNGFIDVPDSALDDLPFSQPMR